MSRGLSSSQRAILLAIQNAPDPKKGLSRQDIDKMLGDVGPIKPWGRLSEIEASYARTNRTMLRLQRKGLVYCSKWCKTWGSHEYDTVRHFTLTQKGLELVSTPLRDAATRSREYRQRKRAFGIRARQEWLNTVLLFTRRIERGAA